MFSKLRPESEVLPIDPQHSHTRLRFLRRQVVPSTGDEKARLFVIPGLDGENNTLSVATISYLFLGKSGKELDDPVLAGEGAAGLGDCVLSVGRDRVDLFMTARAGSAAQKIAAVWRDCKLVFVDKKMVEQTDQYEIMKARYRRVATRPFAVSARALLVALACVASFR